MSSLTNGLSLYPDHWTQMAAGVGEAEPEEACGIIAGDGNTARLVIPITNILHSPTRFRMDPQEQLNAFLMAEEKGWDILAVYHSHPNGAGEPSPMDFEELTFPGIIYLIWYKQVDRWHCRSFIMNTHREAIEVPLTIIPK